METAKKPKPRKFSGVTVQPRWHWSKEYSAWAAKAYRRDHRHDDKRTAADYAIWLAERDGYSIPRYARAEVEWDGEHAKAVTFYADGEKIVTVKIPNHNWRPHVTYGTEPETAPEAPAPRPFTAADLRGYLEAFAA